MKSFTRILIAECSLKNCEFKGSSEHCFEHEFKRDCFYICQKKKDYRPVYCKISPEKTNSIENSVLIYDN